MFAHVDADSFFASVLLRKNIRLRGLPLLATGMGGGCVIAASYEAKALGVRTGMRLSEAKKLAPKSVVVPSDFEEACIVSDQLEEILTQQCPLIEQYSVDEWFLDLRSYPGGMPYDLRGWALELQKRMHRSTDITVSVGIGPTKILAKMASEHRKPAGLAIIDSSIDLGIEEFLCACPLMAIPGIGRKRGLQGEQYGWKTAWDFAVTDRAVVVEFFGKSGKELHQELNGEEVYGISLEHDPQQSVSRCRSFPATRDSSILYAYVMQHLSRIVLKMRGMGLAARGVTVWVRDQEYAHCSTHRKLPQYLNTEEDILPYARSCFTQLIAKRRSYTQVGLALWNLDVPGGAQYSLFEEAERTEGKEKVQSALDIIRDRFGRDSIVRGTHMGIAREKRKKDPSAYSIIEM